MEDEDCMNVGDPKQQEKNDERLRIQQELAGVDQYGIAIQAIGEFNQITTQLPLRHKGLVQLQSKTQGNKDGTIFEVAEPSKSQNLNGKGGQPNQKFAGMINDTVWKYNPNSYYNQTADGKKGKEQYF